jgi:Zinc carboxypeptidase
MEPRPIRQSRLRRAVLVLAAVIGLVVPTTVASASFEPQPSASTAPANVPTPEQFFGFELGTEGKLAAWDDLVEYYQVVAERSNRVTYEELGTTTMGNAFPIMTISSPANLANLDRIVEITQRLADPRGLSEREAARLAAEGKPIYLLEASIHSTEVGTAQVIPGIVHQLATASSSTVDEILGNSVVVVIPSQNPDGQKLVVDYFHETANTDYDRVYPDLYQKYVGHDDNRDWFMVTQKEQQISVALQNEIKPQVVHCLHQMGATGARIFNPPYLAPSDPNIDPITVQQTNALGMEMARQQTAAGHKGVIWADNYDYWTPSRQYMTYHGAPRILTEVASVDDLAYDYESDDGGPIGPQEPDTNFIEPYDQSVWRLSQILDYLEQSVWAGLSNVAKYHEEWLYDFYRTQRDAVNPDADVPYAFVVPKEQRDPYGTYELLRTLETGAVEIHRATAPFTAGGEEYSAGSWIVRVAQPYGRYAKTLLEVQHYPDLHEYPGGPPLPPYDVTAHTLPMLLGVDVVTVEDEFDASSQLVKKIRPVVPAMPDPPAGAYLVGPESYGTVRMIDALQDAEVETYRATEAFSAGGQEFAAGTVIAEPTDAARGALQRISRRTGIPVYGTDEAPEVAAEQVKPGTRIGLYRGIDNMPGGWMMWLFDQYGLNYEEVAAQDFEGDLNELYDTIVLPAGISKETLVEGLDPQDYPKQWSWAYGVGEDGWNELRQFVEDGGTLLAIGDDSVPTAQELLDLPIEPVLPDEETEFYSPGSILKQQYDASDPVAWGMRQDTPLWFGEDDMAYAASGDAKVVSSFPESDEQLASGWLIGDEHLSGAANTVSYEVGDGFVVTYGSEPSFRTWSRDPAKLIFNAMYHGPATPVEAGALPTALAEDAR